MKCIICGGEINIWNYSSGRIASLKTNKNPIYYYVIKTNNPQGFKEHVISFISFAFSKCINIIYCIANMKLYVSNIEKSYKDTIIGHLGNEGTVYLL